MKLSNVNIDERSLQAKAQLMDQLAKFLTKPEKPQILSICRPDKKKNISGLVKAYGEDKELQAMTNLTIFAGIRKARLLNNIQNAIKTLIIYFKAFTLCYCVRRDIHHFIGNNFHYLSCNSSTGAHWPYVLNICCLGYTIYHDKPLSSLSILVIGSFFCMFSVKFEFL